MTLFRFAYNCEMLAVLYRMYRMGVIRLLSTCKSLVLFSFSLLN